MKTSINRTLALNLRQLKICDIQWCYLHSHLYYNIHHQKYHYLLFPLSKATFHSACKKSRHVFKILYYHKLKSGKSLWKNYCCQWNAHKVLMIMMTTTRRTSPTPRPTLSLRSEAFLLSLEASERKRSLDVFSRSDLKIFSVKISN